MKANTKLKKYVNDTIVNEMDKDPSADVLSEGFVDRIANHIKKILTKASTDKFTSELESIAKSNPAGKKAVKKLVDTISQVEKDMLEVERMIAKYGMD
jgi:wobble nucleotide-excising tRNase|tara:strand:+ start:2804 stop:3097 length:294 start_codon:yes stop_codon:yes gene_type:complete